MKKPNTVVVYVFGGVVQEVRSNSEKIDVTVFDVDDLKGEGKTRDQINEAWTVLEKENPIQVL